MGGSGTGNGRALVKEAEGKLKGGFMSCFAGTRRFEEAAELYQQAAVQFKLEKDWPAAANCYTQCAFCAQKTGDATAEADSFQEAGNILKRISSSEALEQWEQAISLFAAGGRFQQAGKLLKAAGELLEAESLQDAEAAALFRRAAEMFALDDHGKSNLSACNLKVAEFAAKAGDLEEAIRLFEGEAEKALQNTMLQYGAKEHLLRAGLLRLLVGDHVSTEIALDRYRALDPRFQDSREGELLTGLATACEEGDADLFIERLSAYDAVTKLDAWKTDILLKVKTSLQPPAGQSLETVDLS